MEYNTSKIKLIIPEYGRNIQTLVNHAKTIEDREYRQAFVEEIVKLVQNMHPQARNVEDYVAKLWSHIYKIAGYDLDVDFPENVNLEPIENKRPQMIPYPDGSVRFRHYGRNVQEMIRKAAQMEDKEKRDEFLQIIAAYMKMAYKSWNQPVVSDESIIRDLKELVGDQIEIDENLSLDSSFAYRKRRRPDDRDNRNDNRRGGDKRDNYRKNDRRGGGHSAHKGSSNHRRRK